jgi:hypothetical protein
LYENDKRENDYFEYARVKEIFDRNLSLLCSVGFYVFLKSPLDGVSEEEKKYIQQLRNECFFQFQNIWRQVLNRSLNRKYFQTTIEMLDEKYAFCFSQEIIEEAKKKANEIILNLQQDKKLQNLRKLQFLNPHLETNTLQAYEKSLLKEPCEVLDKCDSILQKYNHIYSKKL